MLRDIRSSEWSILLPLTSLVALSPWVSGRESPFQSALLWIGLITFVVFLITLGTPAPEKTRQGGSRSGSLLLRDPVFYLGSLFVLFLVVQWLNAGRTQMYDEARAVWGWSAPPIPFLPSSIRRGEAFEVMTWFVPAVIVVLVMRHSIRTKASCLFLYVVLLLNAGVLALAGIFSLSSETDASLFWVPPDFFSAFGYQNHAGSFFTLMMGLAGGVLVGYVVSRREVRHRVPAGVACAGLLLLFLASSFLSLSRAAMLMSGFLTIWIVGAVIRKRFKGTNPADRIQFGLGLLAFAGIAFFLIAGSNPKWVKRELAGLNPAQAAGHLFTEDRFYQIEVAARMWMDHPLYGVGGWGYGHMLSTYLEEERWGMIQEGAANAHCDPIQFLAEFGLLGFGLLVGTVGWSVRPLWHRRTWKDPLLSIPLLGAGLVFVNSLIDLPFRNPGILLHWLLIICASNTVFLRRQEEVRRELKVVQ